jgi:hypothetical protein
MLTRNMTQGETRCLLISVVGVIDPKVRILNPTIGGKALMSQASGEGIGKRRISDDFEPSP